METMPRLPQEIWEHTPVEAPEYIRALEARVAGLEAIVPHLQATIQQLTECLQQTSRTSARAHGASPRRAAWP
jgi:hypothetical protein